MIKQDNIIWIYLVGLIIMFIVLFLGGNQVISSLGFNTSQYYTSGKRFNKDINYLAKMYTNYGVLEFDLYEQNSPENVKNFISLSRNSYYSQTKFHRLLRDLLIQGGDRNSINDDPSDDGKGSPPRIVKDEVNWESLNLSSDKINQLKSEGYRNNSSLQSIPIKKYSLVIASYGPNTNGSQFFIVTNDSNSTALQDMLGRFTTIGEVIAGFEIINQLNNIPVSTNQTETPRPINDIVIERVEIIENT
jgi:cyclophilin family peptidyl-prolyl cis-trans isomerase